MLLSLGLLLESLFIHFTKLIGGSEVIIEYLFGSRRITEKRCDGLFSAET